MAYPAGTTCGGANRTTCGGANRREEAALATIASAALLVLFLLLAVGVLPTAGVPTAGAPVRREDPIPSPSTHQSVD
jgi:hypothetical protein